MTAEDATTVTNAEVKWVGDDVFVGSDDAGHSVVFDSSIPSPTKKKASAKGIGPMTALLTSLGACSGMDVESILLKRRQKLSSLTVQVSGKRAKYGHPKPFTDVHLRYLVAGDGLEEKYVKEAVTDSITKFCSVAATVNGKAKVTYSYEIVRA